MKQQQRATVPARGQLKPGQQIDRFGLGPLEPAQVTEDRSPHRNGHLKIDRPAVEKSSVSDR